MGIYWKLVCVSKQEYIDVAKVGTPDCPKGSGRKDVEVALSAGLEVAALYSMTCGGWRGEDIRFVSDTDLQCDLYDVAREKFRDVTKAAVDYANEVVEENLYSYIGN